MNDSTMRPQLQMKETVDLIHTPAETFFVYDQTQVVVKTVRPQ